ncbi:MAG: UDP-N-acetylmuramoyl-L-alanyl-D-glutamate--2,6-diaminopimelate ligase [Acidimicrobiales bacterium]
MTLGPALALRAHDGKGSAILAQCRFGVSTSLVGKLKMSKRDVFQIAGTIPGSSVVNGDRSIEIGHVTMDHRQVLPGALFCALPGARFDGRDFVQSATTNGAVAILTTQPVDLACPQIVVPVADVRSAVALASAEVYDHPSQELTLIGVTGTNGKTTVVHVISQVLDRLGRSCKELGTLWGRLTTPEAPDLQRRLREFVDGGAEFCSMEVSSIALEMRRVDQVDFDLGVFTNLSPDHMDLHGSMDAYFHAKAQLFSAQRCRRAVIFADGEYGERMADAAEVPFTRIGYDSVSDVTLSRTGVTFTMRDVFFQVPLLGRHNLANIICAITALEDVGVGLPQIAEALLSVEEPRGRLDFIDFPGVPFDVVIDYAHTPAALEAVLVALRQTVVAANRLVVVFGCGGDRDHEKRPKMGEIASIYGDVVVITNDNPRSEEPAEIAEDVRRGLLPGVEAKVILDRREAIAWAIAQAQSGDVVVVAGKGHERTQSIDGSEMPFDDHDVALDCLTERFGGRA